MMVDRSSLIQWRGFFLQVVELNFELLQVESNSGRWRHAATFDHCSLILLLVTVLVVLILHDRYLL